MTQRPTARIKQPATPPAKYRWIAKSLAITVSLFGVGCGSAAPSSADASLPQDTGNDVSGGTGGVSGSGGAFGSGGAPGSGGMSGGGGMPGAGGRLGSGGGPGSGGRSGSGGALGSGGRPGSGGLAGGLDRCGRPAAVTVPAGYAKLTWQDEFDTDGRPSSANWGYEKGFVRNEEAQWYQEQNAEVADGLLVITAKKERVANSRYQAGSTDWKTSRQYAEYTAASLTTSGKQTWQFGRFEMCAQIPIAAGMWPAWWALGVSGEWPSSGEIDMMEYYRGKILANVACGTSTRWQAKWDSATKAVDATWASKYHLWRMDWNSTQIDLYVDDVLMNSAKLSDMLNADGKSPFLQKAYMIVNLAIGGANGGDPSSTPFPQTYAIDYIRVFQ